MFPTDDKSKIPSSLAYPVNAKLISEALADVPQAPELSLSFFDHSTSPVRQKAKSYSVISVQYSFHTASAYSYVVKLPESLINRPIWVIQVQPVPRLLKHHIAVLLQCEVFPKFHSWLVSKQGLGGRNETQRIAAIYNEERDEIKYEEHQSR